MEILLFSPFLSFFVWLYAERKLGLNLRVLSGLACIALTGFACYFLAKYIPRYESQFHRSSIRLAGEMIEKGQTQRVQDAVRAYNTLATNGTTYGAAMEMWRVLNQEPGMK